MPKRIQRKRTKGWRMPENCVCVTRPGKWGNPFRVTHYAISNPKYRAVQFFRECLNRAIQGVPFPAHPNGGALSASDIKCFRRMAREIGELRGKDLACYCKDGDICHADVLLEIANQ